MCRVSFIFFSLSYLGISVSVKAILNGFYMLFSFDNNLFPSCVYQCEMTHGIGHWRGVPHFEIMKYLTKDAPFTYVKAVDSIVSMGYMGSCLLYMQLCLRIFCSVLAACLTLAIYPKPVHANQRDIGFVDRFNPTQNTPSSPLYCPMLRCLSVPVQLFSGDYWLEMLLFLRRMDFLGRAWIFLNIHGDLAVQYRSKSQDGLPSMQNQEFASGNFFLSSDRFH